MNRWIPLKPNWMDALARRVASGRLKQEQKIAEVLGRIANKYKMAKHFRFELGEGRS